MKGFRRHSLHTQIWVFIRIMLPVATYKKEHETPEDKRRRLNRERQQRWKARQSQATLDRLRSEACARASNRLLNETIEQTQARRLANSQAQARRRERETEEQARARRLAISQAQARRRERETEEQAQARRLVNSQAQARRRERETEEQAKARKDVDAIAHRNARDKRRKNVRNEEIQFDESQIVEHSCGPLMDILQNPDHRTNASNVKKLIEYKSEMPPEIISIQREPNINSNSNVATLLLECESVTSEVIPVLQRPYLTVNADSDTLSLECESEPYVS